MAALDYWATLQPGMGLVRGFNVRPPEGTHNLLWSVAADIGLQDFAGADDEAQLALVGAYALGRSHAFVRACGEAVERAALLPASLLPDAPTAPLLEPGALWSPTASATCAAVALDDGTPRRVPAGTVDYPVLYADRHFDATPSGAAAGATYEAAVASAVRELLERDAAMIAWARQARLPAVDLRGLARVNGPVKRLVALAEQAGLEVAAGIAPTAVPSLDCVIAVVIDREAGVAAAGLAVTERTSASVAKALQEALQVRAVLLEVDLRYRGIPAPTAVTKDLERARLWTTPAALDAMDAWLDGFTTPVVAPDSAANGVPAVAGIVVVNLAPRLPPAIRELGWHAVKALSPGLQPLRMNEFHDWSWNHERLTVPERHWRMSCAVAPGGIEEWPHPFI